ncbi:hypothetical protein DUNSADRAFT_610 [Dunaliella salina]|uniref:Alcohol dehydrogenase-like C-terminal domain-containing protein n=1 Tax=Dunaliella salina TaxID=3046 RepID=A0ABQ7FYN7_DUNSA|nr:hypothetical protein DUNSADRAFT_610 [Dunaliella salina]|eukprot:KAF5827475.1 hypothetical protein DUNSADRAFT_610 [Dunaliella salina]
MLGKSMSGKWASFPLWCFAKNFLHSCNIAEAEEAWMRTEAWLKSLGATIVVKDQASVKVKLDSLQFFGRPKLALDAVGGQSAVRLVEALAEGGEVVCYGCASGKAPQWTWQGFVFRELKVTGFNMRRWMSGGCGGGVLASNTTAATASKRFLPVLESLIKLMDAGLLTVAYTEYDLQEFSEALDHALSPGRCSKVLLRMPPMSVMGSNP